MNNAFDLEQSILREETDRFVLEFKHHKLRKKNVLEVQSKLGGKHRTYYTEAHIVDESGQLLRNTAIDERIARIIMKNFASRGDTEAFNIPTSLLDAEPQPSEPQKTAAFRPDQVRHQRTTTEQSFTADGAKLLAHQPIFDKLRDTGMGSIIRATLTNHQVCSSTCQFCSTIARNKKDSVSLEEAKDFVNKLYFEQAEFNRRHYPEHNAAYKALTGSDIRLRGLILSGGGQPNLWPHFTEFVEYLATLDIDLGLITNGFPQKIPEDIYKHFQWIRISITPEDASPFYPQGRFDLQYLPSTIRHNPDVTVGYSYVYGPWANEGIIQRIVQSLADNGFEYCRMLTDCNLTRDAQLKAHHELAEMLYRLGLIDSAGQPLGKVFHQLKYHGNHEEANELWDQGQCFLQTYNVFWDTTGHEDLGHSYCYPCDSVTVLAEESTEGHVMASERRFNYSKWGTYKNTEVEKLYTEPVRPFFDPRENCSSCLFMRNNRMVKQLTGTDIDFPESGLQQIKHINFP